jgi:hypothetical protein
MTASQLVGSNLIHGGWKIKTLGLKIKINSVADYRSVIRLDSEFVSSILPDSNTFFVVVWQVKGDMQGLSPLFHQKYNVGSKDGRRIR